ncbi:HNH endonuclease [Streptomyces sp. NPDC056061]|uniref:HNH endonuclease n=1 Tax=Streptomyces sp. NPDC056061 TaxID=3345700 RepID=UPI0035D71FB4
MVEPFTHTDMLRDWEDHDLYACAFCGGPYEEIEHLVPLSRGGEHSLANLVPSCIECNRGVGGKHARDPWEWLAERFPELAPILIDVDAPA